MSVDFDGILDVTNTVSAVVTDRVRPYHAIKNLDEVAALRSRIAVAADDSPFVRIWDFSADRNLSAPLVDHVSNYTELID